MYTLTIHVPWKDILKYLNIRMGFQLKQLMKVCAFFMSCIIIRIIGKIVAVTWIKYCRTGKILSNQSINQSRKIYFTVRVPIRENLFYR